MIIADTGFWLALFDPRDHHHQKILAYSSTILLTTTLTLSPSYRGSTIVI